MLLNQVANFNAIVLTGNKNIGILNVGDGVTQLVSVGKENNRGMPVGGYRHPQQQY